MILFNNVGPALIYIGDADFNYWIPFGFCEKSPIIRKEDNYLPIQSASTGELTSVADDECFQGREVFVDCDLNLFDQRLVGYIEASPQDVIGRNQIGTGRGFFQRISFNPLTQSNEPNFPAGDGSQLDLINRNPGTFFSDDYGASVASELLCFPMVVLFTKFNSTYPSYALNSNLSHKCPSPGYTFLRVRLVSVLDSETGHAPMHKRYVFKAVPVKRPYKNEHSYFGQHRNLTAVNAREFRLEPFLNLSNYLLDNSYNNLGPVANSPPGSEVLYIPGIPRVLPTYKEPINYLTGK